MSHQRLHPTYTFTQDRLIELQAVVPEAFADGKVNWQVLKDILGENLEEEGLDAEHFGLFWPGKRDARRLAAQPGKGALVPAPGEGVNEDATRNLFIEGDNLEVLKLLQKSYAGRVKMMYIDPPYNTGNDFVYRDDFSDPLEDYLRKTGQADEEGRLLTTNTRADGRFHANWLSMMYPRLRLAKSLLSDDGAICISIDDNEAHNLRQLMNELFGEENFVALLVVQTNPRGRTLDRFIAKTHEYIILFTNTSASDALKQVPKQESALAEYDKKDDDGTYRELELRNRNPVFNRSNRPNLYYPLYVQSGSGGVSLAKTGSHMVEVFPLNSKAEEGCWTWGKQKAQENIRLLVGRQVNTGAWRIFRKDYIPFEGATTKAKSIWLEKGLNHENGKEELGRLFGKSPFDFPKSVELIKKCVSIATNGTSGDVVLDFFSGSCTTAQAVLELNREDGGNRQFVMVQLPEPTQEGSEAHGAGYATLAEIGKERIRRVIAKMMQTGNGQTPLVDRETPEDLGFKVFKLGRSNYKAWQDYEGQDVKEIETLFDKFESPLVEGWKEDDLLAEVLLLQGFPLDSAVTHRVEFKSNKVMLVESDACVHRLFICLDGTIHQTTIDLLQLHAEDVFVCLDDALDDEAKARLSDSCRLNTI